MNRKKLLAAVLCAALLTGTFVSCSKTENTEQGKQGTNGEKVEKTQILTHVFKGENITVPENYRINSNVDIVYTADGRLKMFCQESYEEGETYVTKSYIYEVGLDGSDPVTVEVVLEENMYVNDGVFTDDGFVFTTQNYDQTTGASSYSVCTYHLADGSITKVENINDMFPDTGEDPSWFYISSMEIDSEGYIYLSSDMAVCVLNPDGTKAFDCVVPDYIQELRRDANGVVYIAGYLDNGYGLQAIDKTTKSLGAALRLPDTIQAYEYYFGPGYELYYSLDDGLYGYNTGMEQGEMVISWPNSDLNADNFNSLKVLSPEMVLVSYYDRTSDDWKQVNTVLKKSPDIDLSQVTVIELAYVYCDYTLPDVIIGFNRDHDNIRVVTKDYSQYNTEENGYNGGYTKLTNDILNGLYKPDIVCGSPYDSVLSTLISKGMFVDLYRFIDQDDAVRRDDILGCVKNTFEVDGKLSALSKSVEINTLLARKDAVGDRTSWTLDEMLDFAMNLENGQYLMAYLTRDSAQYQLLGTASYGQFIDFANHTCNFEDPTFIKYLNYIATLPAEEEGGYQVDYESENRYEGYQTGQVVLYQQYYWTISDMQSDMVPFNTEDVVRIGYPVSGEGENGSMLTSSTSYLITSSSEHPEEAWAFLRAFISGKNDWRAGRDGFSVLKSKIYEMAEENKDRHTFYSFSGGTSSWSGDNEYMVVDENGRLNGEAGILVDFSQEKLDEFVAWLDTIGTPLQASVPEEITSIINEEITAFTGGARSAEDTAKIIQSRVSLWLAEHS